MTMLESPPPLAADGGDEFPPGIVCRSCGGNRWRVTMTRKGPASVRRWRTCMACGWKCRTAERIEAGGHPDLDAA